MSLGCGTLASPSAFQKGTLGASSSNGTQHTLPKNPMHRSVAKLSITNHWAEDQEQGPTRLWGSSMKTKLGGEERPDGCADNWTKGEFWNVDSNIRIWGPHEVRRNGASASHDVHRHDQIRRICLPALPGQERFEGRQCVSGVVGADTCFLEAWGFSLGRRDRQARPVGIFLPTGANEQFRSHRSFDRDLGRMTESFRTMRRSQTTPGTIMPATATTLRPEDVGGDAGELADYSDAEQARRGERMAPEAATIGIAMTTPLAGRLQRWLARYIRRA
eukprot:CAMPEP_0206516570 /NCGR_PEP_ID=MMETSP0324_2-20121206/63444_1 /ASSEMBLY_ACC=CAM_ASM_000836 /TAXON_ID=2866 /ORGANISM="Crypthecodinium cohnii, Strain Seligo" /LENGTH=274 /DNA_ID=CAMNT_0054009525 /DNA_START=21 /DNA_END=846 /DNA_ORIENTATION=+